MVQIIGICKYKKLLFGITISFFEVSKQKLCIAMLLYVYNKIYSNEFNPGVPPFSRAKRFSEIPGKYRYLCSFSLKSASSTGNEG